MIYVLICTENLLEIIGIINKFIYKVTVIYNQREKMKRYDIL